METNVKALIEQVNSSLGCLFTKEDVVNLLSRVEVTSSPNPNIDKELLNWIANNLRKLSREMNDSSNVEWSNPQFEINYGNTIELDSIELDLSNYQCDLDDVIEKIEETIESMEQEIN